MRLTKNVREGLRILAGVVEAGSSADILGYDVEQMTAEMRKSWEQVLKAVAWINALPEREAA